MVTFICNCFPHCKNKNCLQLINEPKFYIIDTDTGQSRIYDGQDLEHPYLTVFNPTEKDINFLAIDNCLYNDQDPSRCDCAVFDNTKICFAEIKKAGGRRCKRSGKRRDAIKQLKTTIADLKSRPDFPNYISEAYICVGYNRPHPRVPAASLNSVIEFRQTLTTELFDGNEINF